MQSIHLNIEIKIFFPTSLPGKKRLHFAVTKTSPSGNMCLCMLRPHTNQHISYEGKNSTIHFCNCDFYSL